MSSDRSDNPKVTVLAPLTRGVSSLPEVAQLPQGFLGGSFFARARYASEQKQIDAYRSLVTSKNALVRALTEQQSLIIDYGVTTERAKNLDSLREIARAQIREELATTERRAEIGALRHELETESLRYERDRLKKMREQLNSPAIASTRPLSPAERFKQMSDEIDGLERVVADFRAHEVAKAGGEEYLSPEKRAQLDQLEVMRNDAIATAMGKLL